MEENQWLTLDKNSAAKLKEMANNRLKVITKQESLRAILDELKPVRKTR
jgi:hypothetical protein